MSFKRILIAVDNEPVAAHAADIGMELSRELNAATALAYVIGGTVEYMGDTEISSEQLIALAEQEGKQVLSDFSQRLVPKSGAIEPTASIGASNRHCATRRLEALAAE